jgi:hypothetical protein
MMRNISLIIIALSSLFSCKPGQGNSNHFLEKFIQVDSISKIYYSSITKRFNIREGDTISKEILANKFLIPINDIYFSPNLREEKRYYYSGKYKINDNYYLLAYLVFYDFHESQSVICIYDNLNDRITSTLIVNETKPISRRFTYEKGIFNIALSWKMPNGLDPAPGDEFVLQETIKGYKINEDFIFEECTPGNGAD